MDDQKKTIDLRRLWRSILELRWLYLAAALFCLAVAGWYVYRSMPKTPIHGELLIGEHSIDKTSGVSALAAKATGGMGALMKTFSVGGFSSSIVDNEILILSSYDVMLRTVKNLNLNRSYIGIKGNNKKTMLFGDSPVLVEAPAEYFDTLTVAMKMKLNIREDGKVDVKVKRGLLQHTIAEAEGLTLPSAIETPYGKLQLIPTEDFSNNPFENLQVIIRGNKATTTSLINQVEVDKPSKLSDVVEVSLDYPNVELGKAIVNGIMAEYNAKRLDRVHETAENTIKYYDERIAETLAGLDSAEKKAANYQRDNTLVSPVSELPLLTKQDFEQRLTADIAETHLEYYTNVLKTLSEDLESKTVLSTIDSLGETNINQYNKLIIKRKGIERSAKPGNPTLQKIDHELSLLRDIIIKNSKKAIEKYQTEIAFLRTSAGGAKSQIKGFANKAREFTGLERNLEFQNALYLFLVQERENAVLKLYADTDLSYVYQPAYAEKPGLPIKSLLILLAALVFAVICVSMLAILRTLLSQTTRQPIDLAFMHIDNNAVAMDESEAMTRMRTMLMAKPSQKVLYVADLANNASNVEKLMHTFRATQMPIADITAPSNDLLLSPVCTGRIADASASADYVFVKVPEPSKLFMLENVIEADNAALVVFVHKTMRRSKLKNILKGQVASKVFTIITD